MELEYNFDIIPYKYEVSDEDLKEAMVEFYKDKMKSILKFDYDDNVVTKTANMMYDEIFECTTNRNFEEFIENYSDYLKEYFEQYAYDNYMEEQDDDDCLEEYNKEDEIDMWL